MVVMRLIVVVRGLLGLRLDEQVHTVHHVEQPIAECRDRHLAMTTWRRSTNSRMSTGFVRNSSAPSVAT